MGISFMVTAIVKSLSVARGFRAALLDPGCHPIFGIIGENTMGGLARTVLAETAGSANLELGADQFFLEHRDQIDVFAEDFGIVFIGAKFPIWVDFVIGDCMVKLGVLATSWRSCHHRICTFRHLFRHPCWWYRGVYG